MIKLDCVLPNSQLLVTPVLILEHPLLLYSNTPLPQFLYLLALPCDAVGDRPPDAQAFAQRLDDTNLHLVGAGELFDEIVADVAVFGVGLAVLGEEFDIVGLETIVIFERAIKLAAGQMVRELIA